ncbi:MAG: hypothetical protein ACKVOR_05865 [Flavobacteriales bacterium]
MHEVSFTGVNIPELLGINVRRNGPGTELREFPEQPIVQGAIDNVIDPVFDCAIYFL